MVIVAVLEMINIFQEIGLYPNPHSCPLMHENSLLKNKQKAQTNLKTRQLGESSSSSANSTISATTDATADPSVTVQLYPGTDQPQALDLLKIFKVHSVS